MRIFRLLILLRFFLLFQLMGLLLDMLTPILLAFFICMSSVKGVLTLSTVAGSALSPYGEATYARFGANQKCRHQIRL